MRIEYDDDYVKKPNPYSYPVNGGNVERLEWEEDYRRCVAYHNYPVNGGNVERLAWESAHGWGR